MVQVFAAHLRRLLGRPGTAVRVTGDDPLPAVIPVELPPLSPPVADRPAVVVDASTRTFWRHGDRSTETLVEASAAASEVSVGSKVATLAKEHEASTPRRLRSTGGPGDPAFVELTLVELLRAERFDRAFALLAPQCRRAWGSVDTFAAENRQAARVLLGAEVLDMRRLPLWDDGDGHSHANVAELDVEYAVAAADRIRPVRRTVHLVRAEGAWRSLVYPAAPAASVA